MRHEQWGWALVTGASGGIGREFARLLAKEGWALILVGRSGERLAETKALLKGPRAAEALVIVADLSAPCAADRLFADLGARGIEVEILVNNAGAGLSGPAVDLDPAAVEAMLSLNVLALTSLCALFGRAMRARGRGAILNVGSFAGLKPTPYFAAYAASKAYVRSYSLALRAELASSGVVVSCLLPGYVRTAFDGAAGITSLSYLAFSARNSLPPEVVARAGLRLIASGRASAIVGARNRLAAFLMAPLSGGAAARLMKPILDRLLNTSPRRTS